MTCASSLIRSIPAAFGVVAATLLCGHSELASAADAGAHIAARATPPPASDTASCVVQETYAAAIRAIQDRLMSEVVNAPVHGRVYVVFILDHGCIVKAFRADAPVHTYGAGVLRMPIAWTTADDSVVVLWVPQTAGLRIGRPARTPQPVRLAGVAGGPTFSPYTRPPEVTNPRQVAKALADQSRFLGRDRAAATQLWLYIDANGHMRRGQLRESSGVRALDEAALAMATMLRFTPALNRGHAVGVWFRYTLQFPVAEVRGRAHPR